VSQSTTPGQCEILLFRAPDPNLPPPIPLPPDLLQVYLGGDAGSGGYGYSHAAVDCCHAQGVAEINMYGTRFVDRSHFSSRRFVRFPLRYLEAAVPSVKAADFCNAVASVVQQGGTYSAIKALSKCAQQPDDLMCTDIIVRALPPTVVHDIHAWLKRHHPESSWDCGGALQLPLISPNGFALAFGLPHGHSVTQPELALPLPPYPLYVTWP